jgi:hypothetical protein
MVPFRVKELRGDENTGDPDDDYVEDYVIPEYQDGSGFLDADLNSGEDFIMDEEFPSDELGNAGDVSISDDSKPEIIKAQKNTILANLNSVAKGQGSRLPVSQRIPGSTPTSQVDDLIRAHRSQIRETTEFCKLETQILSEFTLNYAHSGDEDAFQNYLMEVYDLLEQKVHYIAQFREDIRHAMRQ